MTYLTCKQTSPFIYVSAPCLIKICYFLISVNLVLQLCIVIEFIKILSLMLTGVDLIIHCCKTDNVKILNRELMKGPQPKTGIPDISVVDFHSQTFNLVHICSSYGSLKCLKYLFDKGTDVNLANNCNWMPIHFASKHGYSDMVNDIIKRGGLVNVQTKEGYSPIELAAWFGHFDITKILFENGADIHVKDAYNNTPFHRACQAACNPVIKFLLEKGANPHEPNNESLPIQIACTNGDVETLYDLIRYKVDINAIFKGNATIHLAIHNFRVDFLTILLKHGADTEVRDSKGNTALHIAAYLSQDKSVKILLAFGASVDPRNNFLETPLQKACENGSAVVFQILLQFGADPNALDKVKRTPLDWARLQGHDKIIDLYVKLTQITAPQHVLTFTPIVPQEESTTDII